MCVFYTYIEIQLIVCMYISHTYIQLYFYVLQPLWCFVYNNVHAGVIMMIMIFLLDLPHIPNWCCILSNSFKAYPQCPLTIWWTVLWKWNVEGLWKISCFPLNLTCLYCHQNLLQTTEQSRYQGLINVLYAWQVPTASFRWYIPFLREKDNFGEKISIPVTCW